MKHDGLSNTIKWLEKLKRNWIRFIRCYTIEEHRTYQWLFDRWMRNYNRVLMLGLFFCLALVFSCFQERFRLFERIWFIGRFRNYCSCVCWPAVSCNH